LCSPFLQQDDEDDDAHDQGHNPGTPSDYRSGVLGVLVAHAGSNVDPIAEGARILPIRRLPAPG
jgi:hypothetical protein